MSDTLFAWPLGQFFLCRASFALLIIPKVVNVFMFSFYRFVSNFSLLKVPSFKILADNHLSVPNESRYLTISFFKYRRHCHKQQVSRKEKYIKREKIDIEIEIETHSGEMKKVFGHHADGLYALSMNSYMSSSVILALLTRWRRISVCLTLLKLCYEGRKICSNSNIYSNVNNLSSTWYSDVPENYNEKRSYGTISAHRYCSHPLIKYIARKHPYPAEGDTNLKRVSTTVQDTGSI